MGTKVSLFCAFKAIFLDVCDGNCLLWFKTCTEKKNAKGVLWVKSDGGGAKDFLGFEIHNYRGVLGRKFGLVFLGVFKNMGRFAVKNLF